ncbi:hypothetical protein EDD22DRAFT_359236 [Suillus occidentalis]|nr:hypothetical protein EDD22DRAFT_359236 [Suillus occidentalis]
MPRKLVSVQLVVSVYVMLTLDESQFALANFVPVSRPCHRLQRTITGRGVAIPTDHSDYTDAVFTFIECGAVTQAMSLHFVWQPSWSDGNWGTN